MASVGSSWTKPARLFLVSDTQQEVTESPRILLAEKTLPMGEAVNTFVSEHNLHHGDVVRFDDYRDTQTRIVCLGADEKFTLEMNPDESAAGYLTIPRKILQNVTDFRTQFKEVIENCSGVNFHISHKDVLLREKFGTDIPEGWDFDLHYSHGGLEMMALMADGTESLSIDLETETLEDIKEMIAGAKSEQVKMEVKVELKDEKFVQYKEKYGSKAKPYSWLQAKPKTPKSWTIEKGQTSSGSKHHRFIWKVKGPREDKQKIKDTISAFLEGFEFKIEEK